MTREVRRAYVEPRSFEEGNIAAGGASPAAEDEALERLRGRALGVVMVELVRRIPDPRDRAAVQMCVMEGISYKEAGALMAGDIGYVADMKTVWRWGQRGLQYIAEVVRDTPWLAELAPHLPLEHPEPPTGAVPLMERLESERHAEPPEGEGHRTGDEDLPEREGVAGP